MRHSSTEINTIAMQSVRNHIVAISVVVVVFFPVLTSAQKPDYPPESSPLSTSPPPKPQESLSPQTKFVKHKNAIPNWYIVVLNDDVIASSSSLEVRRAAVTAIASSHAKTYRGKVGYIYETALKGYSIELPDEATAIALSQNPQVKYVEEDALSEWTMGQVKPHDHQQSD
jgi:Peptidase inhibitor I9